MTPSERHRRLTQIFIAVCNLDGEERRKTLDRLCRNLPDLRSELDLLLAFHDSVTLAAEKSQGTPRKSGR